MNTESTIEQKLRSQLQPSHLDVINESHMHSVPANSETHFKIVIATDAFEGETLIKRHRTINKLLAEELAGGVHALALHTMTPQEWEKKQGIVAGSPKCLGGSKT